MLGPQDTPTKEDISQTDSRGKEPTNQKTVVVVNDDLQIATIAKELGMDDLKKIGKESDKLRSLIEWAKKEGATDDIDIVYQITKLANRIGSPALGENKLSKLVRYVYLQNERIKLEEDIRK